MSAFRNLIFAIVLIFPFAARAETVTIAALGDSLTQGYGLPADQGLVPQLQEWLRGNGADVTVINAGVSGDTTAGGLSRIGWTLTPEVDAVIVSLGGNDLLRGIDPAASRANIRGILQATQTAGVDVLLVGIEAPGNYGPDYKQQFDAIYPELSDEFDTAYWPSLFAAFDSENNDLSDIAQYMQADGIHPNADGVKIIVDAIGPAVLDLVNAADNPS
ncbi:arylesterase [Parasulfitobacter algicola]|uniref:Arylesterase n=1 Tax=Parasulfitobacter algicola TaxID=2614809 RepID=A0ABX2IUZ9_9RHOB|nr:arylesterase [Sulfitobacter algicola]NSX54096.1 arylesterase [Sulfitobacter algicola]